ncbi:glycoside hydrolase family protein [Salinarchaeum sp. Harcht-Bsk1]|uniref:glycoside hydrolase family 9 protein n=1 Tax=Salinarchaeum sp. Harcht-Bsk1 TaxID=1333523 RepID=UPI000342466F|nr:glycoside hydrolase family 9 protein [Salinarchaeum sp. Harcht-Bsk1]AGN02404.1 glycoside hydrolase family protein [Salinarchaeum sp. Harcht-Bsk1]
MDILVDQLGYGPDEAKRVILQGNADDDPGAVRVEDAQTGEVVTTAEPEYAGHVHDWKDWEYWTADVSAVDAEGEYVVSVTHPERTDDIVARSRPFEVGDDLFVQRALSDVVRYFRVERCTGIYDRYDREATFVGDREDRVDVSGGWYDASGDVSKYLSHLSYANFMNPQQIPLVVWSLLDARDRLSTATNTGRLGGDVDERDAIGFDALEEACFGADFLVRAQDEAGYFYMTVFDTWTSDPEERDVCAYEGMEGTKTEDYEAGYRQGGGVAIAALARASRLGHAGEFGPETYYESAVTGFDHLEANNEAYLDDGVENVIDDYCALLAATELAGAAAERGEAEAADRFAAAAAERARSLLDRQTDDGWFHADDGDRPFFHASDEGLPIVALVRYLDVVVDEQPGEAPADDDLAEEIADAITRYWEWELELTDDVVNPFGYARQYAQAVDEDEPAARFFFPHENESGYWWQGENARLASLAAAAHSSLAVLDGPELTESLPAFARDQLSWILGRNPYDTCMLEGIGNDPVPFVPGAPNTAGGIVNGITAGFDDETDIAFRPPAYADDQTNNWRWTEQWLPHAAWFLVAGSWEAATEPAN